MIINCKTRKPKLRDDIYLNHARFLTMKHIFAISYISFSESNSTHSHTQNTPGDFSVSYEVYGESRVVTIAHEFTAGNNRMEVKEIYEDWWSFSSHMFSQI